MLLSIVIALFADDHDAAHMMVQLCATKLNTDTLWSSKWPFSIMMINVYVVTREREKKNGLKKKTHTHNANWLSGPLICLALFSFCMLLLLQNWIHVVTLRTDNIFFSLLHGLNNVYGYVSTVSIYAAQLNFRPSIDWPSGGLTQNI